MSSVESIAVLRPPIFDDVAHVRSGFSLAGERTAERPLGNNMSVSPAVIREGLTLVTGGQIEEGELDRMVAQELDAAKQRHEEFVRQFGVGALKGVAYPRAVAGAASIDVESRTMHRLLLGGEDRIEADASMIEAGYGSVFTPADCPVIDMVDPNRGGVVAQVHAGWQGIVAGMIPATVRTLKERGLNPARLLVNIHPNATDGFELKRQGLENWRAAGLGEFVTEANDTTYISMTDAVKAQLQLDGVQEARIATSGVYSQDKQDLNTLTDQQFYSHRNRKIAGVTGRNAAFLARIGE